MLNTKKSYLFSREICFPARNLAEALQKIFSRAVYTGLTLRVNGLFLLFFDLSNNRIFGGELSCGFFGIDQGSVGHYFELTAVTRNQCWCYIAGRFDLFRQTDGSGLIASASAVGDGDVHSR